MHNEGARKMLNKRKWQRLKLGSNCCLQQGSDVGIPRFTLNYANLAGCGTGNIRLSESSWPRGWWSDSAEHGFTEW